MRIWFQSLDESSQVMVIGISLLMVVVVGILGYSIASGEGLNTSLDLSSHLDAGTPVIVDAGGFQ